jgi:hypothetical protein
MWAFGQLAGATTPEPVASMGRRWHRASSEDGVLNQPAEVPQRGT